MNSQEEFALWIAVLVIVLTAIVIAWLGYWSYRKKKLVHEERRLMLEKGMNPPPIPTAMHLGVEGIRLQMRHEERLRMIEKGLPVLPDEGKQPWTRDDFQRRGTILVFLGLGLGAGYLFMSRGAEFRDLFGVLAPIIGLIGVGCLVYYRQSRSRQRDASS